jgi:enterochelin esterase family protein
MDIKAGRPGFHEVTLHWTEDQPAYDVVVRLISHTDRAYDDGELDRYLMVRDERSWALTLELPSALRTSYQLCPVCDAPVRGEVVDDERWNAIMAAGVADPLNPLIHPAGCTYGNPGPASVLELPEAPSRDGWSTPAAEQGVVRRHASDDGSVVSVYDPAEPRGLAVMFDGSRWADLRLPVLLDNLIGRGEIAPIRVVLIESIRGLHRHDTLPRPSVFAPFAIEIAEHWSTDGPTALVGQSLGGLAATFTARQRPDLFEAVIGQSSSFWWDEKELSGPAVIAELDHGPTTSQRFFLEAGTTEDLRADNRHVADVLTHRGYDATYREYEGGHDYTCWQTGLLDAFRWTFPPISQPAG